MGDEWVCQDCNYGTDDKPNKNECPLCKGTMVNIGEVEDDLKLSNTKDGDDYGEEELETPLEDDFVDEDEIVKTAKQ